MAGVGEDDPSWDAPSPPPSRTPPSPPPKTLTLDGAVKSSTGHLPSPALFDRFPSLEELSVTGACLSSLVGFPRLLALRRLSLPDNRLSGADSLAAVAESYGGTLRHLDLGNNRFAEVEELAPLQVEALGLYQCPITKVKGYKENVCALIPSLKYLDGADAKGNERLETDEEEDGEEEGEGEGEMEDGEEAEGDAEDGEEGEGDEEEEGDEELCRRRGPPAMQLGRPPDHARRAGPPLLPVSSFTRLKMKMRRMDLMLMQRTKAK